MDSASEKEMSEKGGLDQIAAKETSASDQEVIELLDEIPDSADEKEEGLIELIDDVSDGMDEEKGLEEKDEVPVSAQGDEETVSGEKEIRPDTETALSQLSKEEIEAIVTRAAKELIGEMAERIATDAAERLIAEEIEKIKSAIR